MTIPYSETVDHRGKRITDAFGKIPYTCDRCGSVDRENGPEYISEDHENSRLLLFCSDSCQNDHPHEGGWVDSSEKEGKSE